MRSCNWARAGSPSRTRATAVELYEGLRREPELLAIGAVRPLGAQRRARAAFPGRLLLQDLHVAAELVAARLRTHDPPRAAGLGREPREPDPDRYEHMHAHCDVLVVGAGPAGLMAALAAGRSGARDPGR